MMSSALAVTGVPLCPGHNTVVTAGCQMHASGQEAATHLGTFPVLLTSVPLGSNRYSRSPSLLSPKAPHTRVPLGPGPDTSRPECYSKEGGAGG
jgi:hypothetical protein